MEISKELFGEKITEFLDKLYNTQEGKLEELSQAMADCIEQDGVIQIFGSGHSVGLGIDMKGRPGSLVPIHIMDMNDFVLKGDVPLSVYKDTTTIFERTPDIASKLYEFYDLKPQDLFIVISNSGINGVVIDIAAKAKADGYKVAVVTSMEHTLSENSRHPLGKKLYEYGDIVIDNCGPKGDALLPTGRIEKICSVSSICNNMVGQSCAARTMEILNERGVELPILTGEAEHDQKVLDHYKGRA